jgi:hypothetical protein
MTQSVKAVVYACFAARRHRPHARIAKLVRRVIPTANTTDRSVASMFVDYRRGGGEPSRGAPKGEVKALVYAMFEAGGMTAQAIADEIRLRCPYAQTTHKSVASMKVDWKRAGGAVAPAALDFSDMDRYL